jgi:hypothetical protein
MTDDKCASDPVCLFVTIFFVFQFISNAADPYSLSPDSDPGFWWPKNLKNSTAEKNPNFPKTLHI